MMIVFVRLRLTGACEGAGIASIPEGLAKSTSPALVSIAHVNWRIAQKKEFGPALL